MRASCILHLKLAQRPDGYAFIPRDLLRPAARQAVDKRNMGTVDYFENRIYSKKNQNRAVRYCTIECWVARLNIETTMLDISDLLHTGRKNKTCDRRLLKSVVIDPKQRFGKGNRLQFFAGMESTPPGSSAPADQMSRHSGLHSRRSTPPGSFSDDPENAAP